MVLDILYIVCAWSNFSPNRSTPLIIMSHLFHPLGCSLDVLLGFDVSSQNIFSAQRNLETKMSAILQRIMKLQPISCTSGQAPTIRVGIMALDSASEPMHLEFTDNYTELLEAFRNLRSRGPFVLNGKTIDAYTARFKTQPKESVKVCCCTSFSLWFLSGHAK